jgi:hypothetical protein
MAEKLTLTRPEIFPSITTWSIIGIWLDFTIPAIKVTILSNTGERATWRLVPSEDLPTADIRQAISFINQGQFATLQGKSLQHWILEEINSRGFKTGSVSGTPD